MTAIDYKNFVIKNCPPGWSDWYSRLKEKVPGHCNQVLQNPALTHFPRTFHRFRVFLCLTVSLPYYSSPLPNPQPPTANVFQYDFLETFNEHRTLPMIGPHLVFSLSETPTTGRALAGDPESSSDSLPKAVTRLLSNEVIGGRNAGKLRLRKQPGEPAGNNTCLPCVCVSAFNIELASRCRFRNFPSLA